MEVRDLTRQARLNQWANDINDRFRSGKSVKQWCNECGISMKTYYYRLRRVREAAITVMTKKQVTKNESELLPLPEINKPILFTEIRCNQKRVDNIPAIVIRLENSVLEVSNIAEQEVIEKTLLALRSIC